MLVPPLRHLREDGSLRGLELYQGLSIDERRRFHERETAAALHNWASTRKPAMVSLIRRIMGLPQEEPAKEDSEGTARSRDSERSGVWGSAPSPAGQEPSGTEVTSTAMVVQSGKGSAGPGKMPLVRLVAWSEAVLAQSRAIERSMFADSMRKQLELMQQVRGPLQDAVSAMLRIDREAVNSVVSWGKTWRYIPTEAWPPLREPKAIADAEMQLKMDSDRIGEHVMTQAKPREHPTFMGCTRRVGKNGTEKSSMWFVSVRLEEAAATAGDHGSSAT